MSELDQAYRETQVCDGMGPTHDHGDGRQERHALSERVLQKPHETLG